MAVLFSRVVKDVRYEVRNAGNSIRLYTNDAFHSQYNPNYLFTGAIWDMLALPSLCADHAPEKVLVLGVGGGTVIHQLNQLHQPGQVTGVELDGMHIEIARQFFNLRYDNLKLVKADARRWLQQNREGYDYIVDDVFLHGEGDPDRPFFPDEQWCELLASHLRPGGVVVQNHIDDHHARAGIRTFKRQFDQVLAFNNAKFSNTVVAGFKTGSSRKKLKVNYKKQLSALPSRETMRLRALISV